MRPPLRDELNRRAVARACEHPPDLARAVAEGERRFRLRLWLFHAVGVLATLGVVAIAAVLHVTVAGATGAGDTDGSSGGASVSAESSTSGSGSPLSQLVVLPLTTTVAVGATTQLSAQGSYADGSSADLSDQAAWRSSDPDVATVNDVGLVAAVGYGSAMISASLGGIAGSATVDVPDDGEVSVRAITLRPSSVELEPGESAELTAEATYANGSTRPVSDRVTWQSSDPAVVTVAASGRLDAVDPGTAIITATLADVSGRASVTVSAATTKSLSLAPDSASAPVGAEVPFAATVTYSDDSTEDVSRSADWNTSDSTVAQVAAGGVATCVQVGDATISAEAKGFVATASLSCTPVEVTSVEVSPSQAEVAVDNSKQFEAEAVFSDGDKEGITGAAEWASTDSEVAEVEDTGEAFCGAAGTTTISATFEGKTGTANLTCFDNVVEAVRIDPDSAEAPVGEVASFSAYVTYTDGSTYDYTSISQWETGDPDIAQFIDDGDAVCNSIGQVTITATYDEVTDTAALTCTAPAPAPDLQPPTAAGLSVTTLPKAGSTEGWGPISQRSACGDAGRGRSPNDAADFASRCGPISCCTPLRPRPLDRTRVGHRRGQVEPTKPARQLNISATGPAALIPPPACT